MYSIKLYYYLVKKICDFFYMNILKIFDSFKDVLNSD